MDHEIKIPFFEFWSHDQFVSHKNDHEIETQKSIIREFWSHDQSVNQPPDWNYWKIRPPEKGEFWSHEIRPHDHFPFTISKIPPR